LRELLEELDRQAEPAGRVLDVDDREVDAVPVDHAVERLDECAAPRRADDVADEQDVHLTRVLDRTGLPDHRDLDLAGVLQLGLDLLAPAPGEPQRLVARALVRLDDDAELAARLDRERLLDALEAVGDVLELLESLDVRLEDLAPRPRPRRRQ